jgi:hypothetical protein
MDLSSFKALVALPLATSLDGTQCTDETELLAEIRDCFIPSESDQALLDVRNIMDDIGLRYTCDQAPVELFLAVAMALKLALRERGRSTEVTSNWERAVRLGALHAERFPSSLPPEQQWVSNTRVSSLSAAIRALRTHGYNISLPATGGVEVPDATTKRLADDIGRLSSSLGRALATSAASAMAPNYSTITGRFKLGRVGQTIQLNAQPQVPHAFLYQLGLRYFTQEPSVQNPQLALDKLIDLSTSAVALLDVTVNAFELTYARPSDIVHIMQKSVVYDSVFLVTQVKPAHARQYLEWMMTHKPLADLTDSRGRSAAQILSVALMMLRTCERVAQHDFSSIPPQDAAFASNLDIAPATELLRDIFTHSKGANQRLTFPPKDTAVDAAFRPLLAVEGMLCMQPPPMAARAVVNAALDWCRSSWRNKQFDDEALGPLFEQFVRDKLVEHGVSTLHGDYKQGQTAGECDAVVETQSSVILFELKSKMLTRAGRAGDDVVALADLAQALVRPQAQAMERHAILTEHKSMTLKSGSSIGKIELQAREAIKLSITRGDLGSLHDRPFMQHFLRAGCIATFGTLDLKRQGELDELHDWFKKLKGAAQRAGEGDFNVTFPFSRSWSLSVFQLLLLLERTTDNESFAHELQRTRRLITPVRDFYTEYEYMLYLEQFRNQNSQEIPG